MISHRLADSGWIGYARCRSDRSVREVSPIPNPAPADTRLDGPAPTALDSGRELRLLALGLTALGALLLMLTLPGVFTVDEPHYISTLVALRHGGVSMPGTEGLMPSRELAFFDPASRPVEKTPVAPNAPPLYAWLALPFSLLGLRGLFALQTLSFLATIALIFIYARSLPARPWAPWLAAAAVALGSYFIEYALGLWPHMLAVALTTGAFVTSARVRDGGHLAWALLAGMLAGLAAGVRYQNIIFAGCVGLSILWWAPRRLVASGLYGTGLAVPLAVSSATNYLRFASWNPISKGPKYFMVTSGKTVIDNPLVEALRVFWARVVDYTTRPPQRFGGFELAPSPESGAYVFYGAAKKAWLQSMPWVLVPLLVLLAIWLLRGSVSARRARELRAMSLVVWPTFAVFAWAGFGRTDGLCFNQRYFLELVPLAAVALAWTMGRYRLQRLWLLLGLLASGLVAVAVLRVVPRGVEDVAVMRLPLALAVLLAAAWALAHFRRRTAELSFFLGACLMWAAAVHLGQDVPASRVPRSLHHHGTRTVARTLPPGPAAVFTWRGTRNVASPLQLERDYVILDAARDAGRDAPRLVDELLARGRRVFVIVNLLPEPLLQRLIGDHPVLSTSLAGVHLVEILPGTASGMTPAGSSAEDAAAGSLAPQELEHPGQGHEAQGDREPESGGTDEERG